MRAACACFPPIVGVRVEADAEMDVIREEMDEREVVVPCEKREDRSEEVVAVDWTDIRAEGGRERACGAFVLDGIAIAAEGGGGGGARRVLW